VAVEFRPAGRHDHLHGRAEGLGVQRRHGNCVDRHRQAQGGAEPAD
jgi:hypothetical protein